jgi:DNA-directed RNA polymerase subunit RPC12/RpoP
MSKGKRRKCGDCGKALLIWNDLATGKKLGYFCKNCGRRYPK